MDVEPINLNQTTENTQSENINDGVSWREFGIPSSPNISNKISSKSYQPKIKTDYNKVILSWLKN